MSKQSVIQRANNERAVELPHALPPVIGHNERVLDGVFGKRDVAEDAYQRRDRLPR